MKRHSLGFGVLFVIVVLSAQAQRPPAPPPESKQKKEKKSDLPKLIVNAQYVMVISEREADFNQQPETEDRVTVGDIEKAVSKWGRYKLVYRKEDADLILSVHRATGTRVGAGGGVPTLSGDGLSNPGDHLAVYNAHIGTGGPPLWRKSQRGGLARPDFTLLKAFQDEVEAAAKIP